MYSAGYSRLFWGLLFIIFDINLGQINILPNFIGYAFIYSGLNILYQQHEIFKKGKTLSFILGILTVKDIIKTGNGDALCAVFQTSNIPVMVIGGIVTVLNLYLMFILCKGIYLSAEEKGLEELKESAKTRWSAYLAISVLMIFYMPFSINLSRDVNMLMIIFGVIYVIIYLFIAGLFRKCMHQFE